MTDVRVFYDAVARQDLEGQFHYVLDQSGSKRAVDFIDRIEEFLLNLGTFPEMGRLMTRKPTNIYAISFRRSANVFYAFDGNRVTILRIFAKGQDGPSWLNDFLNEDTDV